MPRIKDKSTCYVTIHKDPAFGKRLFSPEKIIVDKNVIVLCTLTSKFQQDTLLKYSYIKNIFNNVNNNFNG